MSSNTRFVNHMATVWFFGACIDRWNNFALRIVALHCDNKEKTEKFQSTSKKLRNSWIQHPVVRIFQITRTRSVHATILYSDSVRWCTDFTSLTCICVYVCALRSIQQCVRDFLIFLTTKKENGECLLVRCSITQDREHSREDLRARDTRKQNGELFGICGCTSSSSLNLSRLVPKPVGGSGLIARWPKSDRNHENPAKDLRDSPQQDIDALNLIKSWTLSREMRSLLHIV